MCRPRWIYRLLWRTKLKAKGFGFTLRNENDFNMDVLPRNSEAFQRYYGVNDDGNIYDPANIMSLERFVLRQTNSKGVFLLMADGCFFVNDRNSQEIASAAVYLSVLGRIVTSTRQWVLCP